MYFIDQEDLNMEIKIEKIGNEEIKGVRYFLSDSKAYKESYFEWTALPLITPFHHSEIMNGILQGWHHTPIFSEIEYHNDFEQFYFFQGDCYMYFVDIKDGIPDLSTSQIVYIPEGTQLEIAPNKGHFIAVANKDTFKAIVTSPKQEAPRLNLSEISKGVL